ncbi:MAG: hypothetical protein K2M73_07395 [Lachnospiraceae bacterium]|nr:hypothetical protein [Lachnospiraceae bacterium]
MEYNIFRECVLMEVTNILGDGYDINLHESIKNNGVSLWNISIKEKRSIVAPSIYLEEYYERYLTDICDIKTIAGEIVEIFKNHKNDIEFDINCFRNFEIIKDNIRCKLINTEKNRSFLEGVPHIEFLDLSIIFYCLFKETSIYTQSCTIQNIHLDLWNIDIEELFNIAKENTVKYCGFQIKSMNQIVGEMLYKDFSDDNITEENFEEFMEKDEAKTPMYVLTNNQKMFGAVCILYKNILKKFSDILENDFFIIPSSIHEVILIPYQSCEDVEKYNEMVQEVNNTSVTEEDRLADHIYLYKSELNQVIIP